MQISILVQCFSYPWLQAKLLVQSFAMKVPKEQQVCITLFFLIQASYALSSAAAENNSKWRIFADGHAIQLSAGIMNRQIQLEGNNISTTQLKISHHECLTNRAREFSVTISTAQPNQRPQGSLLDKAQTINTTSHFNSKTNFIEVSANRNQSVSWINRLRIESSSWNHYFSETKYRIDRISATVQRLTLTSHARNGTVLEGISVNLNYEIYDDYPVIRKWIEITQHGKQWLKLEQLVVEDLEIDTTQYHRFLLSPSGRGACPSIVAFGNTMGDHGVITASEIPSALRYMHDSGAMGYADSWFEWILGPGETFASEPVFYFAWKGEVTKTISAVSTPLDRTIEGPFLDFMRKHVGIAADSRKISAPQWCSWTHFKQNLSDIQMREQANLAARCGFSLILFDQGWQRDLVGTQPDTSKFPDFALTCSYLRALGLDIGLWVSCYRSEGSPDTKMTPDARNIPLLLRDGGYGMSFASPWRKFYAEDLAALNRKFGISYFKQDFTNIKFGDEAESHESRTRKESLLRGLRGLLESQDLLRKIQPDVTAEITHEIYWGTPGVPCDIAALKHASAYHIPPNDYAGAGPTNRRVNQNAPVDVNKLQSELLTGSFNARQRLYEHRGLPLYAIEYYAAHAVNIRGSLTLAIQDRQICSWLMGVPAVFAGDLSSLTPENVDHYRKRFDLIKRLENEYGIYKHFQFSGVPAPTDKDWHWWGKLNAEGNGAVVVLRGDSGSDARDVNIPWIRENQNYRVKALFSNQLLGIFSGRQLQISGINLTLPQFGQEILEVKEVKAHN